MIAAARQTMVLGQLEPNGINVHSILNAYRLSPRDAFIPRAKAGFAYIDEELVTPYGAVLMPMVEAKMVQALDIKPTDRVLVVGGAATPTAAVCALLAGSVILATGMAEAATFATTCFQAHGLTNAAAICTDDLAAIGTFDAIILAGRVSALPRNLPPARRVAAIIGDEAQIIALDSVQAQTTLIAQVYTPLLSDPVLDGAAKTSFEF